MRNITERIVHGHGTAGDVQLLYDVATQIRGKCLCPLGEFSVEAVISGVDRFRADFEAATANPELLLEQVEHPVQTLSTDA
jgi:NADH-quinone oxidoreductase subunit F